MPICEDRCERCGAQFEEITWAEGAARVRSCECHGRRITRLLSVFVVASGAATQLLESNPFGACGAPQRGASTIHPVPDGGKVTPLPTPIYTPSKED